MAHLKSKFKSLVSFSTLFFFITSVLSTDPAGDAAYMLKLLEALIPSPSDWSSETHMWSGVSCSKNGSVEKIHLYSMSLTGTLPSGLNSLAHLNSLDLGNNSLTGPLPSLANLTKLQRAYFYLNGFTYIPDGCFQGLTSLQNLSLFDNLSLPPWTFPIDLTHSSQLKVLHLAHTNLMGSLSNISHFFPSLAEFSVPGNKFNSIPDGCFRGLTSLRVLSLGNNTNLPPWTFPVDLTHSSQLNYLDLEATNLMGSLPSLVHSFPYLSQVHLANNNLTSIPEGCFQGLTSLKILRLGNNTNLAPWTFPNLTQSSLLFWLDLVATNVMGSLPDIFGFLPNLQTVLLRSNSLTGVLPKSFAGSEVATMQLNDQQGDGLSGTIEVLSSMIYLSQVWLQGNSLEGPIPDLSRCIVLKDLQLGHNRLTGVVPYSLASLRYLETVFLDNNFLQGPVPEFGDSMDVDLGVNTTNGFCRHDPGPCDQRVTILLEIAAAVRYPYLLARSWQGNNPCQNWSFIVCARGKIRTLNLTKLNLTGTISTAFGNLTDLWYLYMDGNNLMGSIPESLTTLSQLKVLDVSNNNHSQIFT